MKRFQAFRLDAANQSLWHGEARVDLTPKAFWCAALPLSDVERRAIEERSKRANGTRRGRAPVGITGTQLYGRYASTDSTGP